MESVEMAFVSINEEQSSKVTTHSNAYVSGVGPSRKIVVQDTLLEKLKDEEILAVISHELGHVAYAHNLTKVTVVLLYTLILLMLFKLVY